MYAWLLCWRYLRTRYIALASIVSVMLGVATMIVVNSVMAGFSETMRERLHGILSDVVVEGSSFDGFEHPDEAEALVRHIGGNRIEAIARTVETPAILSYQFGNQTFQRPVQAVGVEPDKRAAVGSFSEYLVDDQGRPISPTFAVDPALRERTEEAKMMKGLPADDPFAGVLAAEAHQRVPDQGAVLGYATATHHQPNTNQDMFLAPVGTRVVLTFPTTGQAIEPARDSFTTVGYFKSGMSEYDASFVFVPLNQLQHLRRMGDGQGSGKINALQIKTRPGTDLDRLASDLAGGLFEYRPYAFQVATWEQKQGPLLSAVSLEQGILNILLFMIVAVAGFGILAIFSMIVVEKTRDIGILKALGASTAGVRGIFLSYGLSLGVVGSGVGMLGGLLFVANINAIEQGLSRVLGHKVFDDTIYYFNEIPTRVEPWTVAAIVGGALLIAVVASVWPAQRAASLHPVQALRAE